MRVVIGCEESGRVRDAFILRGHDAISCDLEPTATPGPHFQGDIFELLAREQFDLGIFHPPCTYLANSGAKHLYVDGRKENGEEWQRWEDMREGVAFLKALLEVDIPRVCVENPIMHGHAKALLGIGQSQVIQPWQFGHTEQKATCLWLRGLPLLEPTGNVYDAMMFLPVAERNRVHHMPPGPLRQQERSRTFHGIADAMAEQWGGWV